MNIKLISSLLLPVIALFACSNQTVKQEFIASPNIILIYLVDMEYGDLSLTGATSSIPISAIALLLTRGFGQPAEMNGLKLRPLLEKHIKGGLMS